MIDGGVTIFPGLWDRSCLQPPFASSSNAFLTCILRQKQPLSTHSGKLLRPLTGGQFRPAINLFRMDWGFQAMCAGCGRDWISPTVSSTRLGIRQAHERKICPFPIRIQVAHTLKGVGVSGDMQEFAYVFATAPFPIDHQ